MVESFSRVLLCFELDTFLLQEQCFIYKLSICPTMRKEELANAVEKLDEALVALGTTEHEDTRIMPFYIEYWVANELAKRGYKVEIVNRRSYDLLLPEENIRIEVKSGKYDGIGAGASFYNGHQIKDAKFDYCIFATYDIDFRIKEVMIFSREELMEVANKPRPKLAAHPTTNPCLLLRYNSLEQYVQRIEANQWLEIELDLHKYPEKFINNWNKIR